MICISSFLFYCFLYNHSFKNNPNTVTNLSKLYQPTFAPCVRLFLIHFLQDARFSPDGRLPDGAKDTKTETIQHLRDIFYRMGFDDQAIVALSGAHAVGRCHTDRSGFWGPWTYAGK